MEAGSPIGFGINTKQMLLKMIFYRFFMHIIHLKRVNRQWGCYIIIILVWLIKYYFISKYQSKTLLTDATI